MIDVRKKRHNALFSILRFLRADKKRSSRSVIIELQDGELT